MTSEWHLKRDDMVLKMGGGCGGDGTTGPCSGTTGSHGGNGQQRGGLSC